MLFLELLCTPAFWDRVLLGPGARKDSARLAGYQDPRDLFLPSPCWGYRSVLLRGVYKCWGLMMNPLLNCLISPFFHYCYCFLSKARIVLRVLGGFQYTEVEFMTLRLLSDCTSCLLLSQKQSWGHDGRVVVCHIKSHIKNPVFSWYIKCS